MIPAFPYPWPDTRFAIVDLGRPEDSVSRRGQLWRAFHQRHGLGRGLHFFSGSDVNDLFNFRVGFRTWVFRFVLTAIKGELSARCVDEKARSPQVDEQYDNRRAPVSSVLLHLLANSHRMRRS